MKLNELKILSDNTKAEVLTTILHMTNDDFQKELEIMRASIDSTQDKKLSSIDKYHIINNNYSPIFCNSNDINNTYYEFINNILKNICKGEIEFCYYIGQIRELLRFIPDLKVRLNDFYFEVWN